MIRDGMIHGSAVALAGRALLILGPSGAGKSRLALELISLGAMLVGDDQLILRAAADGTPWVAGAPQLRGQIEARGIGILRAPICDEAAVALVLDLGQEEPARLPAPREISVLGVSLPLVCGPYSAALAPAMRLYLLHGRAQ